MNIFKSFGKIISSLASLAKVAPQVAVIVVLATFIGVALYLLLSSITRGMVFFGIFDITTVLVIGLFIVAVLQIEHNSHHR